MLAQPRIWLIGGDDALAELERLVAAGVLHAEAPAADEFAGLVTDRVVACA